MATALGFLDMKFSPRSSVFPLRFKLSAGVYFLSFGAVASLDGVSLTVNGEALLIDGSREDLQIGGLTET